MNECARSMQYQILMATFPAPVPIGGSGTDARRPFFDRSSFTFSNAQMDKIVIEDDDDQFDYISANPDYPRERQQGLVLPVTFGLDETATAVGTQISNMVGSLVRDQNGNQFRLIFPAVGSLDEEVPTIVGGKAAVLILPVPVQTPSGPIFPTFDPNLTFRYMGSHSVSMSSPGAPYGPQRATCFTLGTQIATPAGLRRIEDLRPGDLVVTRDHGPRPLRWIGRAHLPAARLDLQPNLRPIRIPKGALGHGQPAHDLTLSPQHRVLVQSCIAQRMFGASEVLVAVKHLLELPGIDLAPASEGVTYLHLLFDQHELVQAEGAWTESLLPGPEARASLPPAALQELSAIFIDLPPARMILNGREGRQLAFRHAKNRRELAPVF